MSWSKRVPQRIRRIFRTQSGQLRSVPLLLACILAWYLLTSLTGSGVTSGAAALFRAAGITERNIGNAPMWIRWFSSRSSLITFLLRDAILIVILIRIPGTERGGLRRLPICALFGSLAVVLPALGFLGTDSMRLWERHPVFSPDLAAMLPVCFCSALAEDLLVRGLVFPRVRENLGSGRHAFLHRETFAMSAAALLSGGVQLLISGAWAASAAAIVNTFLMNAALILVRDQSGAGASVGIRFGWMYAVTSLTAFPGSGTDALLTLYPVSEHLLTGGQNGLLAALITALICLGTIAVLLFRRIHAGRPE